MYLNEEQMMHTGLDFILENLEVSTPYGSDEKRDIKPYPRNEKERLIEELSNVQSIIDGMKAGSILFDEIVNIIRKLKDIRGSIKRCSNFEVLDEVELFEIKCFCLHMGELLSIIRKAVPKTFGLKFHNLDPVLSILDPDCGRLPTFFIYDSYSEKLGSIRESKRRIEDELRQEKDDERLKELKRNRLDLVVLEEEEELEIRKTLTHSIAEFSNAITEDMKSIGKLDLLIAKARLSLKFGGVRPEIVDNMKIFMKEMVNPEIQKNLESKRKTFTPVSIDLAPGTTVITGANMGGKSVALKTIALNLWLSQMGFFVFCKKARLPMLDFIYLISDDLQSVSRGLSTFGAEIVELNDVLNSVKNGRGFVALDEFARGTNPCEGKNLVKSLCRYLNKYGSISIMSTHFDDVVDEDMAHYQVVGLRNVDFSALPGKAGTGKRYSVEMIQDLMDYNLEMVPKDSKVPHDALNLCMFLGLEQEVIDMAEQLYEEDENDRGGIKIWRKS